MGKIILTESQYNNLRDSLLEMTMRSYIFDWDDNILYMPTTIKMDKKDGDKWVPVDVSTEDFTSVRGNPNYRFRGDNADLAFIDFRLPKPFIKDSGILRTEKGPYGVLKYYIGPNYKKWAEGNLERYREQSRPWRWKR